MTARILIVLGLLLLGFDCADFTVTGITILAIVFFLLAAYFAGAFTREFWFDDEEPLTAEEYLAAMAARDGRDAA